VAPGLLSSISYGAILRLRKDPAVDVTVGGAWWLRRRNSLSIRNFYAPAALSLVMTGAAAAARGWSGVLVLSPLSAPWVGGVAIGRQWRTADLGAANWSTTDPGPRSLPYVSMTAQRKKGPRLALGAGQHVMLIVQCTSPAW
jgi:hypothetical protein